MNVEPTMTPLEDNRIRAAIFVSTHDGDTAWMRVDVMPKVSVFRTPEFKVRVHNYFAAELTDPTGIAMRDYFDRRLKAATTIRLKVIGMSHDRIVCDVWLDGVLFVGELHQELRRLQGRTTP